MPEHKKDSEPQPEQAADGRSDDTSAKANNVRTAVRTSPPARHRVLLTVLGTLAVLGIYEYRNANVTDQMKPEIYLSPRHNIVDLFEQIYPNRGGTHFHRAFQANLCNIRNYANRLVCKQHTYGDLDAIRDELERAIEIGDMGNEDIYHVYV